MFICMITDQKNKWFFLLISKFKITLDTEEDSTHDRAFLEIFERPEFQKFAISFAF